jgi:hypothetical protein
VDRGRHCEGLGDVVESEAAHCLVLVVVDSAMLPLDPANWMQGRALGQNASSHDL